MNLKRAILVAAIALPLLVVLFMGFGRDPHAVPFVLHNKPAPPLALTDTSGNLVRVPEVDGPLQRQPTLINFWATWCYPCQAEHGLLQETAKMLSGRARVLGIVYNDSREAVANYIAQHGSAYPQLLDPNSRTAIDYGVAGVPETFIIDGNGIIVHKQAGVLRPEVIERHLLPLLRP